MSSNYVTSNTAAVMHGGGMCLSMPQVLTLLTSSGWRPRDTAVFREVIRHVPGAQVNVTARAAAEVERV